MALKNSSSERDIVSLLEEQGVSTGAELLERSGMAVFPLWQLCTCSDHIQTRIVGRRFLRLDRGVAGYARLSPSIRREFLTYTVLDTTRRRIDIEQRAQRLEDEIVKTSRAKLALAEESISSTVSYMDERLSIMERCCFIIAGDVTYDMSHTVPRPETSTGIMVKGSDLDIVVVAEDGFPSETLAVLDRAVYERKYFMLKHPSYREEIDYIIKTMARVREQMRFDTFESMVACKILREGRLLLGSDALFDSIKTLLDENDVPSKLDRMEKAATDNREKAVASLKEIPADAKESEYHNLFHTRDEKDEIY